MRNIAKSAASNPDQVPEEVGELANDSPVGVIDANQGSADIRHRFLNRKIANLLPIIHFGFTDNCLRMAKFVF